MHMYTYIVGGRSRQTFPKEPPVISLNYNINLRCVSEERAIIVSVTTRRQSLVWLYPTAW